MITIVSVYSFLNGIISAFVCIRLWKRSLIINNSSIKKFAYCYFFFFLFFLTFFTIGTVFRDGILIAIFAAIAYFFLFVSSAYFIQIPLDIDEHFLLSRYFFWITIFTGFVLFVGNIIYLKKPIFIEEGIFVFYFLQGNDFILLLNKLIPSIIDLFGIMFFLLHGYNFARQIKINNIENNQIIKSRSYAIALGWSILLIAGIINFYNTDINTFPFWETMSAIIVMMGLFVIFRGVYQSTISIRN